MNAKHIISIKHTYSLIPIIIPCILAIVFVVSIGPIRSPSTYAATHAVNNPAISCPGQSLPLGYRWDPGNINTWTACSGKQLKLTFNPMYIVLELYCNGNAIWSDHNGETRPGYTADYAAFQTDGNLVAYATLNNGSRYVEWASNTNNQGATHFQLQGDGNLVIYTASGHALWASNTNGRC